MLDVALTLRSAIARADAALTLGSATARADAAPTLRSATARPDRPGLRPSIEPTAGVRLERRAIFQPLPDLPDHDLEAGDVPAFALLGGCRRFI